MGVPGSGGALALGLAAAQWIPFLELMRFAGRGMVLDPRRRDNSPWRRPTSEGDFGPAMDPLVAGHAGDPAIVCFYVGLVAWGLAGWAAWRGGRVERLLSAGA